MRKLIARLADLTRRNSFRFGIVAVLAMFVALATPHPAYAASPGILNTVLSTFAGLAMSLAEVAGRLVVAVLDLTIPIMQYQGFTTSPVVTAGWAIVRDVVNMFFVVVLIVIAMGTIFGGSRFQWKQQVPKLMLFAIVINFSKTLCGIMIDFAQVVMLTFANALKDIAGGNFIQLLGLGPIFSLSEEAANSGVVSDAFGLFTASVAAVLMMVWVLAVVIMLLFILIYRIVMLWILIVLAPLAWFMGGQSVFKSDAYAEWWKNFICYTAIGPVIVFFLWLTLAVAGSGIIAADDSGFSSVLSADGSSPINNTSGNLTEIFELQHLASFVIGMAMLMAGFDAAAKICSGVKGPGFQAMLSAGKGVPGKIGGFVGGQSRKYGGKALASGWSGGKSLAAGSAAAGLAVAGGAGMAALAPTASGQAARAKGMRDLSKKGFVPTFAAKALSKSADERQADLAEQLKKGVEENFKGASGETKVDYLKNIAKGGMPASPGGKKAALGLLAEAMQDPKMREKLEAAGVLGKLYSAHGGTLKEYMRNTPGMKNLEEFEAGRPDLVLGADGKPNLKGINTMEDVNKLDPTALAALKGNAEFKDRLKNIKTDTKKKYKDGELLPDGVTKSVGDTEVALSALDYFNEGYGGVKKQKAWKDGMTGVYEGMSNLTLAQVPVQDLMRNASPELIGRRGDLASAMMNSNDPAMVSRLAGNPAMYRAAAGSALGFKFDSSGKFAGGDPKTLKAAIKANPSVLGKIPPADIASSPKLKDAIAGAVDQGAAKQIIKAYQKASGAERTSMDNGILEIAGDALSSAAADNSSDNQVQAQAVQDYLSSQIEAIRDQESGDALQAANYAVKVANDQISIVSKNLRDARAELAQAVADADRDRQFQLENEINQFEDAVADARSRAAAASGVVARGGKRV